MLRTQRAKSEVIIARIGAEDRKKVEEAAKANHQTMSEWLRDTIHSATRNTSVEMEPLSSWIDMNRSNSMH